MTNAERRAALNKARANTLRHAMNAEEEFGQSGGDVAHAPALARMWAGVAEAMKDGDPIHDGVDFVDSHTNPDIIR